MSAEPTTVERSVLREHDLFADLPAPELDRLAEVFHEVHVAPGTVVVRGDLPGEAAYFVLEGSIQIQEMDDDGVAHPRGIVGPGGIFGEIEYPRQFIADANLVAREPTRLLWTEGRKFALCLERAPALRRNLIRLLCELLRRSRRQVRSLVQLDVPGRIGMQLLDLAECYGRPLPGEGIRIPIPITQGELAEMVGAERERVHWVLRAFRRAGVIDEDQGAHITIHRPDLLNEIRRAAL